MARAATRTVAAAAAKAAVTIAEMLVVRCAANGCGDDDENEGGIFKVGRGNDGSGGDGGDCGGVGDSRTAVWKGRLRRFQEMLMTQKASFARTAANARGTSEGLWLLWVKAEGGRTSLQGAQGTEGGCETDGACA